MNCRQTIAVCNFSILKRKDGLESESESESELEGFVESENMTEYLVEYIQVLRKSNTISRKFR